MLLPLLQAPSSRVEALCCMAVQEAGLPPLVLCYNVSQSIPCCIDPPPPPPPRKSTSDLARGVGLVSLEVLEIYHGGGQDRFNLNVLRRSQQTHHSRFLLTVG